MRNCPYCGRENADEALRCVVCRTALRAETEAEAAQSEVVEDPVRTEAQRRMFIGVAWLGGGIAVTLMTYVQASTNPFGGTYVIAYGAVIYGAVKIFQSFNGSHAQPEIEKEEEVSQADLAYEVLAEGTRLETKGRLKEALEVYQEVIRDFPDEDAARDARKSIESLQERMGGVK